MHGDSALEYYAKHTAQIEVNNPKEIQQLFYFTYKEIFSKTSKVIQECIAFALLRFLIGPLNSHHFLNQSDAKLKPIMTSSPARF